MNCTWTASEILWLMTGCCVIVGIGSVTIKLVLDKLDG
jgi:hypothetical protein